MEEKELDLGDYEVTWTFSGSYDTLKAVISVTNTGVTCLSVEAGGVCYSATPPGVTISAFTVTGHLKPVVTPPPYVPPAAPPVGTCNQSFRIIEKDTNNPISGATVTAGGKKCTTGADGRCTINLPIGKRCTFGYGKSKYSPTEWFRSFTACTTEETGVLKAPLPPTPPYVPPVTPPTLEVAKFGLSEVVENHLPEWVSGYKCCSCSGLYICRCPAGYKRTVCYVQTRLGVHGCCRSCIVAFVKCEQEAVTPPVTPPVTPSTTISSWIDETGVTNLTKNHGAYVFYVAADAGAAADDKHARLSPKPSKMDPALASKDIAVGIFYYSQGAMAAGNDKTGCNYP